MEKKKKLADVLIEILSVNKREESVFSNYDHKEYLSLSNFFLYGDLLKNNLIGKMLFSCEEFNDVESIEIIDSPTFYLDKKNVVHSETFVLNENTKFKGKVYIYSLGFSNENFDIRSYTKTGEDDILFTPPLYDENSFERKRGITLFFNPETAQDMCIQNVMYNNEGEKVEVDKFRESMHKMLDKALDNPEKYIATGFRNIHIRGYFPDGTTSEDKNIKIKI